MHVLHVNYKGPIGMGGSKEKGEGFQRLGLKGGMKRGFKGWPSRRPGFEGLRRDWFAIARAREVKGSNECASGQSD